MYDFFNSKTSTLVMNSIVAVSNYKREYKPSREIRSNLNHQTKVFNCIHAAIQMKF